MAVKRECVIGAVTVYMFLFIFFIIVKDKKLFHHVCDFESPCVRFCCFDVDTCNEKFIKNNFKIDQIPETNDTVRKLVGRELKIMFGSPVCSLHELKKKSAWDFTPVCMLLLAQ